MTEITSRPEFMEEYIMYMGWEGHWCRDVSFPYIDATLIKFSAWFCVLIFVGKYAKILKFIWKFKRQRELRQLWSKDYKVTTNIM